MMSLTTMWTCHWARRRIQRYLDADPVAPLSTADVHRLEAHLATCDKCAALTAEYRGLRGALAQWAAGRAPDPAAVMRLRLTAEQLITDGAG